MSLKEPLIQYENSLFKKGYFTHSARECGTIHPEKNLINERFTLFRTPVESIFDLASLTKVLVTAPLIIKFFFENLEEFSELKIGDVLGNEKKLPGFLSSLRMLDLLSHRSFLCPWKGLYLNQFDIPYDEKYIQKAIIKRHSLIEEVFNRYLLKDLISRDYRNSYSDLGYILLGFILEKYSKKPLEVLFEDLCRDIGFSSSQNHLYFKSNKKEIRAKCIPSGYCPIRVIKLKGYVHDENCAALGEVSGHAGLFGDLNSLSLYLNKFINSSFGEELINLSQIFSYPVGFRKGDDYGSKIFFDSSSLGHYGFTGTSIWIEPNKFKYGILLTNRIVSGRKTPEIREYRKNCYQYFNEVLK